MSIVAIVGAGPAGMSAALQVHKSGCKVILIDEAVMPGGQIYRQAHPKLQVPSYATKGEEQRKQQLLREFQSILPDIDYRSNTTAYSLYGSPVLELQVAQENTSERLLPDAVIIATGLAERNIPLPGWTLPGVLNAGGAQALLKANGVTPGKRMVVAGIGALPIVVASQLLKAGVDIAAVALLHPLKKMFKDPLGLIAGKAVVMDGLKYRQRLKNAGVEVLEGWAPVAIKGEQKVEEVILAPVDQNGIHLLEQKRHFTVDSVALNFGFNVNSELPRMAGCDARYEVVLGGWVPVRDDYGRTSVQGVYVAGDCAGLRGAYVAAAEGAIVGSAVAGDLKQVPNIKIDKPWKERLKNERFQQTLRRILTLPDGVWGWAEDSTTVCRCEGVTLERLDLAVSEGHCTLDGIKRNTRVGMGWCGGRTCLQSAAAYARVKGAASISPEPMRARPVARPVKIGALANPKNSR